MVYFITAAVLVFGYVAAQDPDCDYRQNVGPNEKYYINNNYSAGRVCRYIGTCSVGYNCRVDCVLSMPATAGCSGDRLLISRSGDPMLTGAEAYCGSSSLTAISTGTSISIALIAATNSRGGSFTCNLTAQPATPAPAICRCGEKKQTRIVGGQETKVNEYTMMAGILERSIGSIHCGGVIISSRHVMTAAHCVMPFRLKPAALSVVVGVHYIDSDTSRNTFSIARFIIHENYNPDTFDYDIALIVLTSDIQFSATIQPVCLPFKYENYDLSSRQVTILGWGTIFFGGPTSNPLLKVDVSVITQNSCSATEGNITDRQICTKTAGKDACQYDSGGPVLYTDPTTGLLFSVGIVSHGNLCASSRPGIHTRVATLLRWIINNANSNFCIKR